MQKKNAAREQKSRVALKTVLSDNVGKQRKSSRHDSLADDDHDRLAESSSKDLKADGSHQESDALNLNIETSLMTKQLSKESVRRKGRHPKKEKQNTQRTESHESSQADSVSPRGGRAAVRNRTQVFQSNLNQADNKTHATE